MKVIFLIFLAKRRPKVPRGSQTGPVHETLCIFAICKCKNGPEHETVQFFAIFKCENCPEHQTVCIFATLRSKKEPDLRYCRNFENSCASNRARSMRLLGFFLLSIAKKPRTYDAVVIFGIVERPRSTRLFALFAVLMAKRARTYDTLAFFKFLLNKTGPEHETVGLFATFHGKKGPDLRYSRNF